MTPCHVSRMLSILAMLKNESDSFGTLDNVSAKSKIYNSLCALLSTVTYPALTVPLAYLTAKSNGLTEQAEEILAQAGKTEDEIELPEVSSQPLAVPQPVIQLQDNNWPLLTVSRSFFEGSFSLDQRNDQQAAAPSLQFTEDIEDIEEAGGDWGADDDNEITGISQVPQGDDDDLEGDDEESGWDIDTDIKIQMQEQTQAPVETTEFVAPTAGTSEAASWIQSSPLASDHIAAGSFETAMQLLNRQVGIVNFEPLKSRFMAIYQASRASLSGNPNIPSMWVYLRRNQEDSDVRRSLPAVAHNFQNLITANLQPAYNAFTKGRFAVATTQFKTLLHSLLFTVVSTPAEAEEVKQLVGICREYLLGLAMEQKRRTISTSPENTKQALELAAYFTHCQLQVPHMQLALRQAAKLCFKVKNFSSASTFARRLLELAPVTTVANEVSIFLLLT
jgi:coatomer protein complex subunit alpha (xenin)